jgi:hypothetical protein
MSAQYSVYFSSLVFLWSVARLYSKKAVAYVLPFGVTQGGRTEDPRMTISFPQSDPRQTRQG